MQVIHLRGDTKNATLYVYFYQHQTGEVERDKECLELKKKINKICCDECFEIL